MQGQSPSAPTRFTKKAAAAAEEEGDEGEEQDEDGGGGGRQDIMDLLPRTDIRLKPFPFSLNVAAFIQATCRIYYQYLLFKLYLLTKRVLFF